MEKSDGEFFHSFQMRPAAASNVLATAKEDD